MKSDISRDSHQSSKRYTGVRLQQGRTILDADWNEQHDIIQREIRERMNDSTGEGAPATGGGFQVSAVGGGSDLEISAGRYYAGGILVENDADRSIGSQTQLPGYSLPDASDPANDSAYLVYLQIRERLISHREDSMLREPALGGPDTAGRSQTLGQVKLLKIADAPGTLTEDSLPTEWSNLIAGSSATLNARTGDTVEQGQDPCAAQLRGGYSIPENRLYRVEVHDAGAAGSATFKWSRENGSVNAGWTDASGTTLTFLDSSRDAASSFAAGQWIELTDEGRELRGESGTLARILSTEGDTLTIDAATATGPYDLASFPDGRTLIRRWDQVDGTGTITIPDDDSWFELEGGIEITFASGGDYKSGDYWLIPARTINRGIEWPCDGSGPTAQPPRSEIVRYARLAFVQLLSDSWSVIADTRVQFASLVDIAKSDNLVENKVNRFGDTMTGTLNIEAGLNVDLDALFKQNVQVDQNLTIKGDFYVEGDVIARDTQHEPGDILLGDQDEDKVTIHGTLESLHTSGALEIDDAVHVAENLSVDGTADISGDTSTGGNLTVTGNITNDGNTALGPNAVTSLHRLDVDGNVRASKFIGDGSMLTNVGNAQSYYGLMPEYLHPTNDAAKHGTTDEFGRKLFFTTIENREPMVSPALGMFLGRRRILFDDIVEAMGERGPDGWMVYKIEGRDDLRIVSDGPVTVYNDLNGTRPVLYGQWAYVEISGYFNGFDFLHYPGNIEGGWTVELDGGGPVTVDAFSIMETTPLNNRYLDTISVSKEGFRTGAPPAIHTARITLGDAWSAYGLDMIATREDAGNENKVDLPAQTAMFNGEAVNVAADSHDYLCDPWSDGYGLDEDGPGYYDEGLDAWENYVPVVLAVADHTAPQVFSPALNVHDHVLNTTNGGVYRVQYLKNLFADEHQALSPDKVVWTQVDTIDRTVADITSRTDLVANEVVYSSSQQRVYKVLDAADGTFANASFNHRRPLYGGRVSWFAHPTSRDLAGNATVSCAVNWVPPRASALGEMAEFVGAGQYRSEPFQIGSEMFLAVPQYYNGNYAVDSRIFRWNGGDLEHVQDIDTTGATCLESFEIDGESYLAAVNHNSSGGQSLTSTVHKWDGSQFVQTQSLVKNALLEWLYFAIGSDHYLLAVYTYNTNCEIFKWNGTQFDFTTPFQSIGTNYAHSARFFTIDGEHYLAFSENYNGSSHNISSRIYKWNGTQFDTSSPFQSISTTGTHDLDFVSVGSGPSARHFLIYGSYYDGGNYNTSSQVYEWNGTQFEYLHEIELPAISHIRHVHVGDETFVSVGQFYNGSTHSTESHILRWDGTRFAPMQRIKSWGSQNIAFLNFNSDTFAFVPSYYRSPLSSYNVAGSVLVFDSASKQFVPFEARSIKDERDQGQSRPVIDDQAPDYSREERSERLHAFEFGNGDKNATATVFGGFDTIRSNSNRAFVMDDGCTSLTGQTVETDYYDTPAVRTYNSNGFFRLTFFGTGLRVGVREDIQKYTRHSRNRHTSYDLCSGLPLGTHTVEWFRVPDAENNPETIITLDGVQISRDHTSQVFEYFEIFQPRRAELPENFLVLGEYSRLADVVQQTEPSVNVQPIGTRRSHGTRDFYYDEDSATDIRWNYVEAPQPQDIGGLIVQGGNVTKNIRYGLRFYGTGAVLRFRDISDTAGFTIYIDGSSNLLGYVTSTTSGSINPSTGVFTPGRDGDYASSISILGLPLGDHRIEVVSDITSGFYHYAGAIEVVTPVHRANHYARHESATLADLVGGGDGITNDDLIVYDAKNYTTRELRDLVARGRRKSPSVWSQVSKSTSYGNGTGDRFRCERVRGSLQNSVAMPVPYGTKNVVYSNQHGAWYIKESGTYRLKTNYIANNYASIGWHLNGLVFKYSYGHSGTYLIESNTDLTLFLKEGDVLHGANNGTMNMHYSEHHNSFTLEKID